MVANASARKANPIGIIAVSAAEQRRRVDEVIARRAYEIFERRGGEARHELEDWRQAESDVRSNLCFGLSTSIGSVLVGCDAGSFEKGSLEVWVAPRQVTLCGKPLLPRRLSSGPAPVYCGAIFRVITLPAVIDPNRAFVHWKSSFLEIHLPIVGSTANVHARAV
jgi:hypothetical protein